MQKIAIEPNLAPIREYLDEKGYKVESINIGNEYSKRFENYDAFIVTGQNINFLGINDTNTRAVVIDASGLTPEQVYHELQLRL
jgi:hypothetical protein